MLVKRPEDFDLYDQAFRLFWRDPTRIQPVLDELLQHVRVPPAPPISRRLSEAWRQPASSGRPPEERGEIDAVLTFSADEILRARDFDQMSTEELAPRKVWRRWGGRWAVGLLGLGYRAACVLHHTRLPCKGG